VSVQAAFCATLAEEWSLLGTSDAVICPGSRSTPLALALAARFRTHVRLDERSAGFFALGLAQATGKPVVICVTSGTAAAELLPAVVEASHAVVPLIVCTADRPPELHDTGAPQTIEQVGLFASVIRWAISPGVPSPGQEVTWRPLAIRAYFEATDGPTGPGPVHLNLAFREPLHGRPATLPERRGPMVVSRRSLRQGLGETGPGTADVAWPFEPLSGRGIIVVGGLSPRPPDPVRVRALAERLRWPVMADPRSGSRVEGTIAAADAIVRTGPPLPETVLLLGTPWVSKALGAYVSAAAGAGARVIVVDPWRRWPDPNRIATEFHQSDTDHWLDEALNGASTCAAAWLAAWEDREARAQQAIADVLGNELNEPNVARAVHGWAERHEADVFVSASMPLRDLEWFAPAITRPPRVFANRGANGIDGVVSTALGLAAAGSGRRTVALLGDLAFLHDVSGLVNLPEVPCAFVVVDNGGGGIFSFLPQAGTTDPETFELLFGTPPTSDVAAVARGFGMPVEEASTIAELEAALERPGPLMVRARVPSRAENVAVHEAINEAVRRALQ
jgi:2-succinyl-5-enolpyruvyl-6-hydroxy-3-cyclohexene-1-carboxylate synthase